jgi:hypothetical protein
MQKTILLLAGFLAACSPKPAQKSVHEIPGAPAEQVAQISKMLSRQAPLPSTLREAHFVEEKNGDGLLGPSDFAAFYALTVAPADLPAWRAVLPAGPKSAPDFAAPKQPQPWWIAKEEFAGLTFYSPETMTGRSNGWVAIAPDGRIFIYAFTM